MRHHSRHTVTDKERKMILIGIMELLKVKNYRARFVLDEYIRKQNWNTKSYGINLYDIIQNLMKYPTETDDHTYKTIFQDFCESGKKFEEIYPEYLNFNTNPDDKKKTESLNKVAGLYLSEKTRGGKVKYEKKKFVNPFIQIYNQNKNTNLNMMNQFFVNKENVN